MTSPDPPILPGLGDVVGPAKDRLIAVRPSAQPFVEADGYYGRVILGWRGQFGVARLRLAGEVDAARLGSAAGDELSELCASNFDTPRLDEPRPAVGEVVLSRAIVHYAAADPDPAISTADATDEATFLALWAAVQYAITLHALSVFDASEGTGAHRAEAPLPGIATLPPSTMGDYVAGANALRAWAVGHFADTEAHPDADTLNALTTAEAAAATPGGSYSAATARERAGLLAVVNATKRALNLHFLLLSRAGTIRKGSVAELAADPSAVPPYVGGQYAVARDVYVPLDARSVTAPIDAVRSGPAQNLPAWAVGAPVLSARFRERLFDATSRLPLSFASLRAAGGSGGQPDVVLRRSARAGWTGRYGPTVNALVAGALRALGVERVSVREDPDTGTAYVHPVDASWAQSDRWLAEVLQVLRDGYQGLGCRVKAGAVTNRVVRLELTVKVRDAAYLDDTSAILENLQVALRAYFDEREGYWIWRAAAIRAVCSAADRLRVKSCTVALVRDASGVQLAEPAEPDPGQALVHWWFADNALDVTFLGP